MGIINVIWSCLSVLSVLFAGIILYHEKITKNDILGVILILIGLYFVFMDEHEHNIK
jgi:drug/metabolite transporter (DMT)-like permease